MGESLWEYYSLYAPGIVLVTTCVLILTQNLRQSGIKMMPRLPPGPSGWPILGSLTYLTGDGKDEYLAGLVKKYGGVFTLRLGCQQVVVLSKHDVMASALSDGHVLSERAPIESLDRYFQGRGIAGAKYGNGWQELRQFTCNIFRSLGVGRRSFEENILAEFDHTTVQIEQLIGNKESFDPMLIFNNATANIIGSVIYGPKFDRHDEVFETMKRALHRSLRLIEYGGASTFLPFMRYLPTLPGLSAFYQEMDTVINCHRVFIDKYKHQGEPAEQQTILDAYISEIKQDEKASPAFREDSIPFVVNDLFMGGTETSATVLTWAVLALIKYPQIQEKIQQEIDYQVPCDRQVTLADKPHLPYTQAVLLESLRFGSIVPATMRATTRDATISGYDIPAGTIVMLNYQYCNFDTEVWDDPAEFSPSRFLDQDGKIIHRKELIPYSIGRRSCPGDGLGRMEIFLLFSNLLKSFHFESVEGGQPTLRAQSGLTRVPMAYTVRAHHRFSTVSKPYSLN